LWFYADNNSYKGCPLPERQSSAGEEPIPKRNSTSELENSSRHSRVCHSHISAVGLFKEFSGIFS